MQYAVTGPGRTYEGLNWSDWTGSTHRSSSRTSGSTLRFSNANPRGGEVREEELSVTFPYHTIPFIHPLYTLYTPSFIPYTLVPMYTRYTCIYTLYTPNTPLNILETPIYTPYPIYTRAASLRTSMTPISTHTMSACVRSFGGIKVCY